MTNELSQKHDLVLSSHRLFTHTATLISGTRRVCTHTYIHTHTFRKSNICRETAEYETCQDNVNR